MKKNNEPVGGPMLQDATDTLSRLRNVTEVIFMDPCEYEELSCYLDAIRTLVHLRDIMYRGIPWGRSPTGDWGTLNLASPDSVAFQDPLPSEICIAWLRSLNKSIHHLHLVCDNPRPR